MRGDSTPDRLDALAYHELTKHSVASVHANQHSLDWANQPRPFKIYTGLEPIPLPRDFEAGGAGRPDSRLLARLLYLSAGITRTRVYPGGREHHFRAAACTGALYHIDLYVVCGALPDLDAGVYHFGPHDFALRRLRAGDYRRVLLDASGDEPAMAAAPVLLVCASTFWRNAWKYQSRTYRHCFWDSGTLVANLLAAAETPARVVVGFADDPVNRLLGLDSRREAALACIAVGRDAAAPAAAPPLTILTHGVDPLSQHEVDYPMIAAAHAGSELRSADEACRWRHAAFAPPRPAPAGTLYSLAPDDGPVLDLQRTIAKRGSTREFSRRPVTQGALSQILRAATAPLPCDFAPDGPPAPPPLTDLYLIVHAVEGIEPGAYVYHPREPGLELLRAGVFRRQAGHLDLGQELAADAAVNVYCLSDLGSVVACLGNRGYRAAALEAGILGGRIYLAAYSLGLGATGLTFFDDDVTGFFSPHSAGKGVLFLTAVGKPRRAGESD